MSTTRVKICGIRSEHDLELAIDAGADAVGLLCAVPVDTPREIATDRARELAAMTPPFVTTVLVTMWESLERTRKLLDAIQPGVIQIHGTVDPTAIERIATDVTVIRGLDADDSNGIADHAPVADALLLDSTDDRGAGGTGRTHDWDRAREVTERVETPVILAGGLTPDNVGRAIERVRPYGVDVASGVDGEGGKDPDAVRSFVAAATGQSRPGGGR